MQTSPDEMEINLDLNHFNIFSILPFCYSLVFYKTNSNRGNSTTSKTHSTSPVIESFI